MADEPRRSGRATKGQHTKERHIAEDAATKKKGKGKGAKAKAAAAEEEEEDGEELIRCVCGQYEEEEDNPRSMICCDNCSAWQHNSCMGLPEDFEPEQYFCEQCKPENHKDLVAAIERGEKPWEAAIRAREIMLAEKAKKKGGRKGRKSGAGRTSEVASQQDVESSPASTPAAAGQKRKLEESPSVPEIKNKKIRGTPAADANGSKAIKTETPSRQASRSESVSGVAVDMKELTNPSRKSAASTLVKLIEQQIKAVKPEEYTSSQGKTDGEVATQLGLRIEHGMYNALCGGDGEPNDAYKNQLRSITYNVKKNRALGLRLLKGDLSPHTLATMDSKDMATDELKSKEKAMIKEMERQHTIIEEQGPRIRRTHKGDEYVDESRQVAAESITSNAPVRKPSTVEQDGEVKSPRVKSPSETPATASRASRPRPSVETTRRQSSANFDIDKVWSNVQGSPEGDNQRFGEVPQVTSPTAAVREPMAPGTKADADIDELLKDEEAESPPYSPKDAAEAEGVVWRGVINGGNLGRFHVVAKYAAGATPDADTLRMTYNDLLPAEIDIGGRIQPARADEYLCGLEYSNSSDLVIVCMPEPTNSNDQEQFDRFFRYFKHKDRFGVGLQYTNPAIKDIYLIPLDAGQELPTFVKKLETDFPDPAEERMLLVPIVIKNSELPHNMDAAMAETPVGNAGSPSLRGASIAQTPITPHEGAFPYPQSPMPGPHSMNGTQLHHAQQGFAPTPTPPASSPPNQSTVYAQTILGPELAACPSVVQLCAQAPNAGENEFRIVKECLQQNTEARNDLSVLTVMLQKVMQQSKSGGAGDAPKT